MVRRRRPNPAQMRAFSRPWASGDGGSEAQLRYLRRGLERPGGTLPLYDQDGQEIPKVTIRACMAHGWAEPISTHPIHGDWVICRLTPAGYRLVADHPDPGPRLKPRY
jgi:hypothetical protein